MPITRFPDPRRTSREGIVAVGDLHPDSLRLAYARVSFRGRRQTIRFSGLCPPERGILEFDRLHIPRAVWCAESPDWHSLSIRHSTG